MPNQSYVLINHAQDGTHNRVFKTEQAALEALAKWFGREGGYAVGQTYYGDWGNRLIVEKRPAKHTASKETKLREAYDARECGTATKRQMDLLEGEGF